MTVNGLLILDAEERDQALAWALHHGTEVQLIPGARLRKEVPELLARPPAALLLPAVASVRNPRLLQAARRALAGRIRLREDEEAMEILSAGGRVTGVRTSRGMVPAERVVMSAGAWTARLLKRIEERIEERIGERPGAGHRPRLGPPARRPHPRPRTHHRPRPLRPHGGPLRPPCLSRKADW